MVKHYNFPSLHEEPRNQRAQILLIKESESLYKWIESTGRFKSYESDELHADDLSEELDDIMEPSIYEQEKEEEGEALYL
ncbi:MAG: DUF3134 domain-containing protein [Brasilonema angustatum HA4187-MV1]|jgi:hypothetical protein|nr:DUF3134 domain-containing protein [Brasilonema angustatum HA4187-MV1]